MADLLCALVLHDCYVHIEAEVSMVNLAGARCFARSHKNILILTKLRANAQRVVKSVVIPSGDGCFLFFVVLARRSHHGKNMQVRRGDSRRPSQLDTFHYCSQTSDPLHFSFSRLSSRLLQAENRKNKNVHVNKKVSSTVAL